MAGKERDLKKVVQDTQDHARDVGRFVVKETRKGIPPALAGSAGLGALVGAFQEIGEHFYERLKEERSKTQPKPGIKGRILYEVHAARKAAGEVVDFRDPEVRVRVAKKAAGGAAAGAVVYLAAKAISRLVK